MSSYKFNSTQGYLILFSATCFLSLIFLFPFNLVPEVLRRSNRNINASLTNYDIHDDERLIPI